MPADYSIAVHQERLAVLGDRMDSLETKVDTIGADVVAIKLTLAKWEGGWKATLGLASAVASVVGALVSTLIGRVL